MPYSAIQSRKAKKPTPSFSEKRADSEESKRKRFFRKNTSLTFFELYFWNGADASS
ncbi:hypothetical protein Fluta_0963 [Fluviicola taffensis DSM 16823]|uniref:Uncharacterized protein n=1 Tax=Fluviicola taffensis (strain DSM 16823 / NCIMB 13979 / RW262) TaxID=755732 RepID=F2IK65_FLUTR|nr:hypothetical protein Fluta_0963 [Fluviicola taffensis DSM 16823]